MVQDHGLHYDTSINLSFIFHPNSLIEDKYYGISKQILTQEVPIGAYNRRNKVSKKWTGRMSELEEIKVKY